jgi:CRISPR/Cas system-associated protein endoribonuclease Cas2
MAKWGFDMIDREIYMRLLEELEQLKAENEKLRKEVDRFQRKTAGMFE